MPNRSDSEMNEKIISTIPSSYKRKAKGLIDFINMSSNISYDASGQIKYKEAAIPNSNIIDIVNSMVRNKKTLPNNESYHKVREILISEGIPKKLINGSDKQLINKDSLKTKAPHKHRVTKRKAESYTVARGKWERLKQ